MPKKRYSENSMARAIMLIVNEGLSTADAAERTGINLRTLQRYKSRYIDQKIEPTPVFTEIAVIEPAIPKEKVKKTLDVAIMKRAKFLDDVFDTKKVVLERIKKISKSSDNLDALQRSLKTLSEIETEVLPKEHDVPAAHANTVNMFNFFNQQLIDEGYEGPELTDADIVKGD
jgi:hypothetical protein